MSIEHNCLSSGTAAAEMRAVASLNTRVRDPVYHFFISWPESERPTDEQMFDCARYALQELGMEGHQYVSAVHRDTDNLHVHIVANRVNPNTYRAATTFRDYLKLSKAMRELELRFGWSHDDGPYRVIDKEGTRTVERASTTSRAEAKRPAGAAAMEVFEDRESLWTYARGAPRVALLKALRDEELTWKALHRTLAAHGLALLPKGMGLAIYSSHERGGAAIKASDMHEELGHGRLLARLGPYEPGRPKVTSVAAEMRYDNQRPLKRSPELRETRRAQRAEERRQLRADYDAYCRNFVRKRLDSTYVKARFDQLRLDARIHRAAIRTEVANPQMRRVLYSIAAFEAARRRDRLAREIRAERRALRNDPRNRRLTFREFIEQLAATGNATAIARLRGFHYNECREIRKASRLPVVRTISTPSRTEPVFASHDSGFFSKVLRSGSVVYYDQRSGEALFTDHGTTIDQHSVGQHTSRSVDDHASRQDPRDQAPRMVKDSDTEAPRRGRVSRVRRPRA